MERQHENSSFEQLKRTRTAMTKQSGVLKMLGMGSDEKNLMDYFKKIKLFRFLFPEYDPTDALKMPQLMAE
jgi:hypothetical protein